MTTTEQLQRIEARLRGAAAERAPAAPPRNDGPRHLEPIAIVGLAGFFPGCRSVREFWQALDDDRCLLQEIPPDRFDWREIYDPSGEDPRRSCTKWGGFIPDVRGFDADFFNFPRRAADLMDPRQRLLLMAVHHALEDAGWAPASLRGSRTGVFVAAEDNDYLALQRARQPDRADGIEEAPGMIANRISHHFDFRGASEYINTLCSGGAVALHRAVQSLRGGEIDAAIVGAANVMLRPEPFIEMSRLNQLSPTASVYSFGKDAQGHLRSEAIVSVVLKPLARAEADGDTIYALIKHTAVNHTGRGAGSLTTPDPTVHAELVRDCAAAVGLDPRELGYIEAQGMGNPLSDLAEWRAFNLALRSLAKERGAGLAIGGCLVGTLKPLAGHMEAASSLAALAKIVHGLQTGRIFGIHGFTERHPELNTEDQPCGLATSAASWSAPSGRPRVAGLHAHGLGGNNAHVLVEEYVSQRRRPQRGIGQRSCLVVLSAPTEEVLAQQARDLAEWVESRPETDLDDLAFTLQVGRDAFVCRLALVVHSPGELARGLASFAPGRGEYGVFHGRAGAHVSPGRRADWSDLAALAQFWVAGGAVVWADGCEGRGFQRIPLPGYPFALQPCWFDREDADAPKPSAPGERPSETEVRRRLIALVAEELKLAHGAVEPGKHFVEHGIDSLAGLRLAQRLGRRYGTPVRLRDWLEHPTVDAYSRFFTSRLEAVEKSAPVPRPPARPRNERSPLSEAQRGLWALQQIRPDTTAYNVPIAIRAHERIERKRLEAAARRLIERHPLLACRIQQEAGELWLQPENAAIAIEETDLRGAGAGQIADALEERLRRPFDLERGPLVRFHLLQVTAAESILLLALHHIVVDGLSTGPILTTLQEAYERAARGEPAGVAEPAAWFADFVRGEKAQIEGESGERLQTFWKEQLAGELTVLELLAERPREAARKSDGAIVTVPLDRTRARTLAELGRAMRVTPATVFLGVFQTLLHRYSGFDDIIVGVPTQVRPDERFADEVGYFLNLLPIRGRNLSERSFAELAHSLQRTMADAVDHAAYPFPRMVRDLGLTSAQEMNPIVQVAFEFQNLRSNAEPAGNEVSRRWTPLEEPRQAGEYDLALEVVELAAGFELHFKFATARYAPEAVRRFADHFCALADSIASRPELRPAGREMLGAVEKTRLLVEWNATQRDFPRDACLHELIERQAQATPEAIAIRFEDRTMTYRELDERSEALARHLQEVGVGPDAPVAICLERSPEMIVGLLAILKAGGAYVPLDATYPTDRLAFMAKDSRAAVILTQTRLRASMASWLAQSQNGILRVVVEVDGELTPSQNGAAQPALRERRVTPEHLAYAIYTSGSTGVPKGVMISHRALVNALSAFGREPGLRREDRLLAVTTLSFDIAGLELFLPLLQGAECCLASPAELADAETLKEAIRRIRPTVMQATPSTWRSLFHAGWRNEERVRILCGGEALPDDLAQVFVEGGMEAWNVYGPTETTIWSTTQRIQHGPTGIGRPIANTRVYVVDSQGNPLPVGVPGGLLIGGEGLARGYWQRPELTAERFVELQFRPGERLYRTGDIACWREDGTLHCLGRTDHQVKVRGHRIELGEIETQLGRHPDVGDCAVIVRDNAGSKQIVAFYIAAEADDDTEAATAEALQSHLRRDLPAYMIPALFVRLDALPQTLNGKKDRKALAARRIEAPAAERAPSAPESALEAVVLQIWRELLRVENLRATDAFFEVGGDSVSAVMVAARISQQLAVPFTVTDLFRTATPRAIAADLAIKGARREVIAATRGSASALAQPRGAEPGWPDYYLDSLAIIGMSCRFPGADDHREFWANLRAGFDSGVMNSPEELRRSGVPGHLRTHPDFVPLRMTIDGKDEFDPDFFNLPAKNAVFMDPQFRLLLMHAWKAIEDAGYTPKDLGEAGVYMAVSNTLYASALLDAKSDLFDGDNYVAWLMAQEGSVATMISYQLGLHGPSYAVHANCASSLVALHAAWQCLRAGDTRCALVGAASVLPLTAQGYLNRKGLNFASDGRCRAYDAAADGTIAGEGAAVLLVKRASDAVADGDHIYAIVRGVGVTNDGAEKVGFYAPGVAGHAAAVGKALRLTGVDPASISYVEGHGTGTKLGDPVEVAALTQAYATEGGRAGRCGLGSVKSNIGHLDTAAGLAGCIKVALSLQHRELPPTLHFQKPNPELKIESSPFHVVDRLRSWTHDSSPRRAGLSSLGIGGTNAHAILEEWRAPETPSAATQRERAEPCLVVLSAADPLRLREAVENLARFLRENAAPLALAGVAHTLQVGRVAMAARVAFVASSIEALLKKLAAFLAGGAPGEDGWIGGADGAKGGDLEFLRDDEGADALIERWLAERKLAKLAQLWVRGGNVDWRGLYRDGRPRRVSLPTYPFAREKIRLPTPLQGIGASEASPRTKGPGDQETKGLSENPGAAALPESVAIKPLHPLLHENLSTLAQQRYRATLTGEEFFLSDHRVRGERLLPAVACLEMARAAVAQATGAGERGCVLRNIAWVRPFVVAAAPRSIEIALSAAGEGSLRFEISAPDEADATQAALLCEGIALLAPKAAVPAAMESAAELRPDLYPERYDAEACYAAFRELGVDYGPSQRGIVELFARDDDVLARLTLPAAVADTLGQFALHPALLDAAVQASIGFTLHDRQAHPGREAALLLPFALEELEMMRPLPREAWARVARRPATGGRAEAETLDIDVLDRDGAVCVRLRGFFSRGAGAPTQAETPARHDVWLIQPAWREATGNEASAPARPLAAWKVLLCGLPAPAAALSEAGATAEWIALKPDASTAPELFTRAAAAVFWPIKAVLESKPGGDVLVQVVIPKGAGTIGFEAVSGMLRTACLEQPRLFAQVVSVESDIGAEALTETLRLNRREPDAAQARHSEGRRRLLSHTPAPLALQPALPWRLDGVYLITGGGGALAWIFAEEIVRAAPGARIVLAGRSPANTNLTDRIERAGGRIEYRLVDVTRRDAVETLIADVRREAGALHGVIHAAGVIDDGFILRKTPAGFAAVLAPKVAGVLHLDAVLGNAELDFFVAFSSVAGVFGSVGQCDYAAANAFLDEFAEHRQALVSAGERRGRTLSIAWPLWRDGGMRVADALVQAQGERTGFTPMTTAEGLAAFYQALAVGRPRVVVLCGDRRRIDAYLDGLRERPPAAAEEAPSLSAAPDLAATALEFVRAAVAKALERPAHRIKETEKFERYGLDSILAVQLTNELEKTFGSLPKTLFFEYPSLGELRDYFVLHHGEKLRAIAGSGGAGSAGLSVTAELGADVGGPATAGSPRERRNDIRKICGVGAPHLQERRSILTSYIAETKSPTAAVSAHAERPPAVTHAPRRAVVSTDIAIIGMTGRFPGAADLAEFWENLKAGRDGITEVPADRWDWRDFDPAERGQPELTAGKWGGWIDGVDRFDPQLFNMAPREAELVDPQERLFLETVWNLLESVGYTREAMRARYQGRVAVYAASMYQHYHAFRSDVMSEAVVSLSSFSGIANRVSYFFDFQGPSVAVDTMCSSSIVAIQMACDCLRSGEAACAIAGGVNLSLHYKKFLGLTASKLMGTRAESRSFADGDGYLPAEGVGAVLLKPLAQAVEDGDAILGVIKAATTNHSGQSGGFAVPNPQAQAAALANCLARAGVDLRTVTYVESAANGSPLGDSIEIKALRAAFAADVAGAATRRVGSVKSNIGHAEAASGMAQLAKVVLQMQHRQLVPTIKARPLNPNLELDGAPFRLQEELEEWKRPVLAFEGAAREFPLRSVIQSVGAGGSSAHLVIEEFRADTAPAAPTNDFGPSRLILLSARTRERLAVMAENLQRHLEADPSLRVVDVAHALIFGREPMDWRAALVVRSRAESLQGLVALTARLRDEGAPAASAIPLFLGDLETANPAVRELLAGAGGEAILQQWIAARALEKLGAWWTQGGDVPWSQLEEKHAGRIVPLPTYPFERRRCWIRERLDPAVPQSTVVAVTAPIAPSENVPSASDAANMKAFLRARVGEVLGLTAEEVSVTKPLNTLGFTSLDAVNLKSRLEQSFAIEVPLATLNAYQTINRLDDELRPRLAARTGTATGGVGATLVAGAEIQPVIEPKPAERHQPFPLSDIQESFFAGRKLGPGANRAGCHIYFEIELPNLDVYRLNTAWNRLVAHHEMLRAVFRPDGTQQIFEETPTYRIKAIDLRRLSEAERDAHLAQKREAMSHRIYDPEKWPLFEIGVSLLPERRVIHFSIDELIVDAASIDVLFQHWHRLYENPIEVLPALELSYRDYVLALRRFTAAPRYAKDMEYWVEKLRALPPGPVVASREDKAVLPVSAGTAGIGKPALPGPREAGLRAEGASRRCARLEATLPAAEWSALKRRAEVLQVSPTALLLGLFSEVLRAPCEAKAFSLILTFFNRLPIHPQIELLVGPLISTSIFLAEDVALENLPERLRRTQRALWADLDHNSVSGIAVLRELARRRLRPASVALPVVFTSMLGNRQAGADTLLRNLTYSVTQTPQVYLDHQLYEEADELRFSWDFVPDYFAPGLIEGLFESYRRLLRQLAAGDEAWSGDRWRELAAPDMASTPALKIRAQEQGEPFPLTDQQQAYAYGRSEHGGGRGANVYLEFDAAHLDVARLEAAWRQMIAAHPMLRTTLRADGRQQTLAELPRYTVRVEDSATLDDDARREALGAVAREMSARVCPLDGWPYFELRVSRLPDGAGRIHLCVDLIVADGASIDRLVQELFDLYADPAMVCRPTALTFRDYVLHLRELAGSAAHAAALRHWNEKFADIPSGPKLPRAAGAADGAPRRLTARQAGWDRLRLKAAELQVAPGMILLAAFVDVLWARAQRKPFTIVIPCWERPAWHPEIDRVIGDFTAMSWLVVRDRAETFAERVVRCHRAVQADLAHGAASGLQVLRKLSARKPAVQRASFPVVFTNLSPVPPLRLPKGMRLGQAVSQTPQVELDNMTAEHGDELELCWDVAAGAQATELIEAMFADYIRSIAELAGDAGAWEREDVSAPERGSPVETP